jgi:hypothetical protein
MKLGYALAALSLFVAACGNAAPPPSLPPASSTPPEASAEPPAPEVASAAPAASGSAGPSGPAVATAPKPLESDPPLPPAGPPDPAFVGLLFSMSPQMSDDPFGKELISQTMIKFHTAGLSVARPASRDDVAFSISENITGAPPSLEGNAGQNFVYKFSIVTTPPESKTLLKVEHKCPKCSAKKLLDEIPTKVLAAVKASKPLKKLAKERRAKAKK